MEIDIFARSPNGAITERIGSKFGVLWKYRRYVTGTALCEALCDKLNEYINNAVMILKVSEGAAEEVVSEWSRTEEEYSRLVVVFMCYYSVKLALEKSKSYRVLKIAALWCKLALSHIMHLSMWMEPLGFSAYIIRKSFSNNEIDYQIEMYMNGIQNELIFMQNEIQARCAEGDSHGVGIPKVTTFSDDAAGIGVREGYSEVSFPSGGNYKGEWKNGKPNGYGIKTNYLGEILCGVFEDGELRKRLPKILVSLKLKRYV